MSVSAPPTAMVPATAGTNPPAPAIRTIAERISAPSPQAAFIVATIYGKGGVGKTSLLATMPGRGLVIDIPQVEGGTFVLADEAGRIDVFQASTWADFSGAYKYLRDEKHAYKWVAIDSITAAQVLGKRKTLSERDLAADPHAISQQDWGKIGELNAELYYRYCTLPMHVIFIAQEQLKGSGDDGALEYSPSISPASLTALQPRQTLIGRLYTREVTDRAGLTVIERHLRVAPHARAIAKCRSLRSRPVPPTIKDPHLGTLFSYLRGGKAAAPEAATDSGDLGVIELA